jgi:hypothetical protein
VLVDYASGDDKCNSSVIGVWFDSYVHREQIESASTDRLALVTIVCYLGCHDEVSWGTFND